MAALDYTSRQDPRLWQEAVQFKVRQFYDFDAQVHQNNLKFGREITVCARKLMEHISAS